MADVKFSEFADGGALADGDTIVGLRAGVNTKFDSPADPDGPFLLKENNLSDTDSTTFAVQNLGLGKVAPVLVLNDADFAAGGGTYVLTNPVPTKISLNATSAGRILQLPPQNEADSLQDSEEIELLTAEGSQSIEINTAGGNQIFLVVSGSAWRFVSNDRTTLAGAWVILGEVQGINLGDGGDLTGIVDLSALNSQTLQSAYDLGNTIQLTPSRPLTVFNQSSVSDNEACVPSTGSNIQNQYAVRAWVIVPNKNILITTVQWIDADFASGSRTVNFYSMTPPALLISGTVSKTDTLVGVFRTHNLASPFVLLKDIAYVVTTVTNPGDSYSGNADAVASADLAITQWATGATSVTPIPVSYPNSFNIVANLTPAGFFQYEIVTPSSSVTYSSGDDGFSYFQKTESTTLGNISNPVMTTDQFRAIPLKDIGLMAFSSNEFRPLAYNGIGLNQLVAYISDLSLQAEGGVYGLTIDVANTVGADTINVIYSSFQRVQNRVNVTARLTFVPTQIDPTISIFTNFNLVNFSNANKSSGIGNVWLTTNPTGLDGSCIVHSLSGFSSVACLIIAPAFDSSSSYELNVTYSYEIDIAGFENPFISIWEPDSFDNKIGLPLMSSGTYDFIVDWGDGSFNRIQAFDDPNNTHTYASLGTYTVKIYGICVGWNFNNSPYGYNNQIFDITQWGILVVDDGSNFGGTFLGTGSLLNISALDTPDFTNMTQAISFLSQSVITNIVNLSNWNFSVFTDTSFMFSQTPNFIGEGIQAVDMSNVAATESMFEDAVVFNPSSALLWDVSSLANSKAMFRRAEVFNQSLPWTTTTSLTDPTDMFSQAVAFEGLGLENWVTTSFTTMVRMFDGIDSGHLMAFNGIVSDWDVNNVTNMTQAFNYCASFNLPLNWDTSSCTSMFQMFTGCASFNQDMPNFVTATCTVIINILAGCTAFNGDISTWDLTGITGNGMVGAFFGDTSLNNIGLSSLNAPNATTYDDVFNGCTVLDQDFSSWPISNIVVAARMFDGVTLSTANYNALLIAWNAAPPNDTVAFSGGNSHYDGAGVAAHDSLTGFYTWFITDGGTP